MGIERRDEEILFVRENDEGQEIETIILPSKFEVCATCRGKGSHSLAVDGHGITEEEREREWDAESWDDYLNGAYDQPCATCMGLRVTCEIDWDHPKLIGANSRLTDLGAAVNQDLADEAAYEAECRAERRMGA